VRRVFVLWLVNRTEISTAEIDNMAGYLADIQNGKYTGRRRSEPLLHEAPPDFCELFGPRTSMRMFQPIHGEVQLVSEPESYS
jgi:hypothetical protein